MLCSRFAACEGAHAAAARMGHDHDMVNAQAGYPEFERRGSAVEIFIWP